MAGKTYKRATLEKRLERLEESLHKEKSRLHGVIDNTGWGAGIRRAKCTPSFRREAELKEKIRNVKQLIAMRGS